MKKAKLYDIDGIKLIYKKITTNNAFCMLPCFTTGAISENDENCGITHFLEHMLGKQTKNKNAEEMAQEIQKYFPNYNAFTSFEKMSLYCSASTKLLEKGFEIFSDIVLNSVFNEEKVKTESKVIEQEIVRYEGENESVAYDNILTMFLDYPFAKNTVLGKRENVLSYTNNDIDKRYKRLLCKENFIISFAGNVPLRQVKKLVKKYFSSIPSIPENKINEISLTPSGLSDIKIINKDVERCNVILGYNFNVDKYNLKEVLYNRILNTYLNSFHGELWNNLREEKGLVYSFYVNNSRIRDVNIKNFFFETYSKNIKECIHCYSNVLHNLYENGLPREKFDDIIQNIKYGQDKWIESPNEAKAYLSDYLFNEIFLSQKEFGQIIDSLEYNEFNKDIKEKMLFTGNTNLCIVGKVDEKDIPTKEELIELFKKTK